MICRITGKLESITGSTGVLELPGTGMGRQVLLPAYLATRLADRTGSVITLITLEYLESQNQGASFIPRLLGFTTEAERDFFELFTTVKGIGNRKALRALAEEPAVVARAIAGRDTSSLQKLPEIGKRLAETIVAELTGKVEGYLSGAELASLDEAAQVKPARATAAGEEAVAALIALGQTRVEAERQVALATARAAAGERELKTADEILSAVFAGA